jgi:hypothetical protein
MRKEYTVSYRRDPGTPAYVAAWRKRRREQFFPLIRVSGKWLRGLGFPIGAKIEVEVFPGRLVLQAVPLSRTNELAAEVCESSGEGG